MNRVLKTRRLSPRRLLAALAVVGVLGVGAWLALPSGLRHHWLEPAPQLDPATPRVQGGYTLAEVHLEGDAKSSAAAYVLVRTSALPACPCIGEEEEGMSACYLPNTGPPPYRGASEVSASPIIQATGQTSDGDVLPLPWEFVGDSSGPKYLRVDIPGGYSNTCRFMDITLVTRTGTFPKWRISRLPTMRRAIPDTPALQTSLTVQGIPISARAWRMRDGIYLQVLPILPPSSHQWETVNPQRWSQWEKFDQPHAPAVDTINHNPIEGRSGHFTEKDTRLYGPLTTDFLGGYRSASRYVRLDCGLRQFATLDEKVTFPNIPIVSDQANSSRYMSDPEARPYFLAVTKPMTLTTPSGIVVTLPAQPASDTLNMSQSINVDLTTKSSYSRGDLPHSPLVQQFGTPVTVSLQFASPGELESWTMRPGDTQTYSLHLPLNPKLSSRTPIRELVKLPTFLAPPHSANLTVILHQYTEIQTIPISFTVPVSDTPPPDFHR